MLARKLARAFYISTYITLIVGIGLSLLVTGYDLVQQTLALAQGGGRYFYIFIIVGAYVATGVFSGLIALARLLTVREALSNIPKRYMPIKKIDVPNPVHKLISAELTRSAIIRHSTLPAPSHRGLSPPTQVHYPSTSYTPIVLHSAILIMSKASRFRRSLVHRKRETLRQYITRARDEGLWPDEVAKEGLHVWLNTYDSVRFGGIELSEEEFLATMKLIYYLLKEMKPPDGTATEYTVESVVSSGSSSSFSTNSDSIRSFGDTGLLPPLSRNQSTKRELDRDRSDEEGLKQIESLISSPNRKSVDTTGAESWLGSIIDHGSVLEDVIDREERNRRMRSEQLGHREGSVIYYDTD